MYSIYLLSRKDERQTIHFGRFLLCIYFLILELPNEFHTIENSFKLMPVDFERLEQCYVYLKHDKIKRELFKMSPNI